MLFGRSTLPEAVGPIFWTLLPPAERAVGEVCGTKLGRPGVQLSFGSALWDPEQVMELLPQTQSKIKNCQPHDIKRLQRDD